MGRILNQTLFLLLFIVSTIGAEADLTPRPYDAIGPGVSTIGPGGNYATFSAALSAINGRTLVGGDWTFLITSDLTESGEVYFAPLPSDFTTTFRPAPGTQPTLSLLTPTGYAACWVGGYNTERIRNIVFDGSNTVGGRTRDLTIQSAAVATTTHMFLIMGKVSDITFRNTVIKHRTTITHPTNAYHAFMIVTRWEPSQGLTDAAPENITIENCRVESKYSPNAQNFHVTVFNGGGVADPPTSGSTGIRIIGNDCESGERCLLFYHGSDLEFSRNRIVIDATSPAFPVSAIHLSTIESLIALDGMDITVDRNEIIRASAPSNGSEANLCGILLDLAGNNHHYRITNNSLNAIQLTGSTTATRYGGIQMTRPFNGNATVDIHHNSINILRSGSDYPGLNSANCTGIGILNAGITGTFRIHNNLIRNDQPNGSALCFAPIGATLEADGNCLYASSGIVGRFRGVDQLSLQDWQQASGGDLSSTSLDPLTSTPGRWIQGTSLLDANLRFPMAHSRFLLTTAYEGVAYDLDGKQRGSTKTTMGAVEGSDLPNPALWYLN